MRKFCTFRYAQVIDNDVLKIFLVPDDENMKKLRHSDISLCFAVWSFQVNIKPLLLDNCNYPFKQDYRRFTA